jgi:hypothetical protein
MAPSAWYKRGVYKFVQSGEETVVFVPEAGDVVSTSGAAADAAGPPISR